MKAWYDKYIGIPYANRGREMHGADCWGLAILVYRNELGLELPSYGEISAENLAQIYKTMVVDKDDQELWQEINLGDQLPFDICVMRGEATRRVCHVGIVIDKKKILHVEKGIDSVIVSVTDASIRERISCYRRHKKNQKF